MFLAIDESLLNHINESVYKCIVVALYYLSMQLILSFIGSRYRNFSS